MDAFRMARTALELWQVLIFLCNLPCAIAFEGSSVYRFRFTAVRSTPHDGVQLGGLGLMDQDGTLLSVVEVLNPAGVSPASQQPEKLFAYQASFTEGTAAADAVMSNSGKWYDGSFGTAGESVLEITLASTEIIGSYLLRTTGNPARRDPVSWSVEAVMPDGTANVLQEVSNADAPSARNALYDEYHVVTT